MIWHHVSFENESSPQSLGYEVLKPEEYKLHLPDKSIFPIIKDVTEYNRKSPSPVTWDKLRPLNILYSDLFDSESFSLERGVNLSTSILLENGEKSLIRISSTLLRTNHPMLYLHKSLDTKRQILYTLYAENIPFTPPSEIRIYPSEVTRDYAVTKIDSWIKRNNSISKKRLIALLNKLFHALNPNIKEVEKNLLGSIVFQMIANELSDNEIRISRIESDLKAIFKEDCSIESLKFFINKRVQNSQALRFILNLISLLEKLPKEGEKSFVSGYWVFDIKKNEKIGLINELMDLLNHHPMIMDFVRFHWNTMSSGERTFLKIFSRFYSIREEMNKQSSCIICIDEGDLTFHPQWQKQFLKTLLDFFNDTDLFKIPIYLVLTSHSPFLVSDLPKNNIIFLDKNKYEEIIVASGVEKENTFGGNIHTLLADAFFIQNGLIGEFARTTIDSIFQKLFELRKNKLNKNVDDKNETKQLIKLIGEPIVSKKLSVLYDEVFDGDLEDEFIENQIAYWQNKKSKYNHDKD